MVLAESGDESSAVLVMARFRTGEKRRESGIWAKTAILAVAPTSTVDAAPSARIATEMKTPPHRIAVVGLILLVLAGAAVWRWQQGTPVEAQRTTLDKPRQEASSRRRGSLTQEGMVASFFKAFGTDNAELQAFNDCSQAKNGLIKERGGQIAARTDTHSKLASALTSGFIEDSNSGGRQISGNVIEHYQAMQKNASRRIEQAWLQEPDDPQARWLAMMRCASEETCNRVEDALTRAEPNNMVVWLQAMEHARTRGDHAAMADAFQRAAAATDFDSHAGSTVLLVVDAYKDLPTPESCLDPRVQRFMDAVSQGLAGKAGEEISQMALVAETQSFPSYTALREYCTYSQVPMEDGRRSACMRIYALMAEKGMSAMEQSLAITNAVQLANGGPDEAQWRERYRQNRWLMEHYANGRMQLNPLDAAVDEMGAVRAKLQAQGKWPPPANWLPAGEGARSLIQTGRQPPDKTR